jgi:hypothetical protein
MEPDRLNFDRALIPPEPQNLYTVNSMYDDYNAMVVEPIARTNFGLIFSTNRNSQGDNYDFISFECELSADLMNGNFEFNSCDGSGIIFSYDDHGSIVNCSLDDINSAYNELGPYLKVNGVTQSWSDPDRHSGGITTIETHTRFFYANDSNGDLDIYCYYYHEYHQEDIILRDHINMSNINSDFNDAYPTIMTESEDKEIMYFTSDRNGDFDIFSVVAPDHSLVDLAEEVTITRVQILSSEADDKCPYVKDNLMVFTSDREGGYGGFDLYYSLYNGDEWSSPVNFGAIINTEYDEYRPLIIFKSEEGFFQNLLIFSSNRPGGLGGFDLYYAGFDKSLLYYISA